MEEIRLNNVFVLITATHANVYPVIGIVNELVKKNVKVTFYCTEEFRPMVQKSGAKFREYSKFPSSLFKQNNIKQKSRSFLEILSGLLDFSDTVIPELIRDLDQEQPDLVIIDNLSLHAKFLLNILHDRYEIDKSENEKIRIENDKIEKKRLEAERERIRLELEHNEMDERVKVLNPKPAGGFRMLLKKIKPLIQLIKPPRVVKFSSSFAIKQGAYPDEDELTEAKKLNGQVYEFELITNQVPSKQTKINQKYFLKIENTAEYLFSKGFESFTLVSIFPGFQPRVDLFGRKVFKFIGCCLPENVDKFDMSSSPILLKFMEDFSPRNPLQSVEEKSSSLESNKMLIYVSLGRFMFKDNWTLFDKIIHSIVRLELALKTVAIRTIISIGSLIYPIYQKRVNEQNYYIQNTFSIHPFVPQCEVLKRASLFITHASVNSSSEAIHYAVPMLCLPMKGLQPLVAQRLVKQLKVGTQLDPANLDVDMLFRVMKEMVSSDVYLERMIWLSKTSHEFNGNLNGCKEILKLIDSQEEER